MAGRFKFKVWDKEKKLLTRPGNVAFVRGELVIANSVTLQFSGFLDKLGQEIYEEDILLIGKEKHHVYWDEQELTWKYKIKSKSKKLTQTFTETTVRGYNAYEKDESS